MQNKIEQELEDAEPIDDGLSNEIYFKNEEVIKIFRKYPFTSFYTSLLEIPSYRLRYLSRQIRMDNEVAMRDEIRKSGLKSPEITFRGQEALKYKKAKGEPGYSFLNECSSDEAEKLGNDLAEFLKNLHNRNSAIRDIRISNCIIDDDNDIHLIDLEYSDINASKFSKWIDYLQIISSVKQTKNYTEFMEGFGNYYLTQKIATLTALLHASLLERSIERTKNVVVNSIPII